MNSHKSRFIVAFLLAGLTAGFSSIVNAETTPEVTSIHFLVSIDSASPRGVTDSAVSYATNYMNGVGAYLDKVGVNWAYGPFKGTFPELGTANVVRVSFHFSEVEHSLSNGINGYGVAHATAIITRYRGNSMRQTYCGSTGQNVFAGGPSRRVDAALQGQLSAAGSSVGGSEGEVVWHAIRNGDC